METDDQETGSSFRAWLPIPWFKVGRFNALCGADPKAPSGRYASRRYRRGYLSGLRVVRIETELRHAKAEAEASDS